MTEPEIRDFGWLSEDGRKRWLVNYGEVRQPLGDLIRAVPNILSHEPPPVLAPIRGARGLFRAVAEVSVSFHRMVMHLCQQVPRAEAAPSRFIGLLSPILRVQLEHVFLVVFILEDLKGRVEWYHRDGVRQLVQTRDRYRSEHGTEPSYHASIADLDRRVGVLLGVLGESESSVMKKIHATGYFPTPGKMLRSGKLSPKNLDFLSYLDSWFYSEFSEAAHSAFAGLSYQSSYLEIVEKESGDEREKVIEDVRSRQIFRSLLLLLAFLSELEVALRLGRNLPLLALWTKLCPYWPEMKEVFTRRNYGEALLRA